MKRKTIITISGEDGKKGANFVIEFKPDLPTGKEPPDSGWAKATAIMLDALKSLGPEAKETPEVKT